LLVSIAVAIVASFAGALALWASGRAGLGTLPSMWLCLLVFALLWALLPELTP
jgi:hypothetical protein